MNTFVIIWMALIAVCILILVLRFIFIKGYKRDNFSDEYNDYVNRTGSGAGFIAHHAMMDNSFSNPQQDNNLQPANFSNEQSERVSEQEPSNAGPWLETQPVQHSDSTYNNSSADSSYDSGWGGSDNASSSDSSSSGDSSSGSSSSD